LRAFNPYFIDISGVKAVLIDRLKEALDAEAKENGE
jgi:hypothetical protein